MTRVHRLERRELKLESPLTPRSTAIGQLTPPGDGFERRRFQSPADVDRISEQVGLKHSGLEFGSDAKTQSNCSIYTFDVIKHTVEKDGGKLDAKFQLQWMNAVDPNAQFDGKDPKAFGPANALKSSGLGYMVANANAENFDLVSKRFMKGDFVQLQGAGGHQGVLMDWGKDEEKGAWMAIRGFQHNKETGGYDVNVKRVYIQDPEGAYHYNQYDRAIVARYDPNETYRVRPKVELAPPRSLQDSFKIDPLQPSDLLGHLRLR